MSRAVVFVHGMWSQACVWDGWLSAFSQSGYRCHVVALPAHHSDVSEVELACVGFDDCVDAVASVATGLERPILIGHSMGGLIVQKLAQTLLLSAAVLLNSAAPRAVFPLRPVMLPGLARHFLRWGLWKGVLRLSRREADYLLFSGLDETDRARWRASSLPESGLMAYQLGFGRLGWSRVHEVDLTRITCPMLALAGGRDHMIPIGVSRAMSRFYGSKLRYREQPECGHWLIGEAGYPERIAEIHSWLSAHGA
ncbi:MAG: hypothetical protein RLZZ450_1705 [Pseudomonadota bacterium]